MLCGFPMAQARYFTPESFDFILSLKCVKDVFRILRTAQVQPERPL